MRRGFRSGIDLFIEQGAYTALASAVSILVVLTLTFSAATAVWSMSRAGDVQLCADSTALAGANVVSSYHTAATVVDASILSLGLAGYCTTAVGLVGLLVPGAHALGARTVEAGIRMLKTRNRFATSASRGLRTLEGSLPYLIAANSARLCAAQRTDALSCTGVALAAPRDSASAFPALDGDQIDTAGIERASSDLNEASTELQRASEESARAKRAAWIADCGRDGRSMRERAASLSSISSAENPMYASSITWKPQVAIDRARAYYRCRLAKEAPQGPGVEEQADSSARRAFYTFALDQLRDAVFEEHDGRVVSTVRLLPRNTAEVRQTTLFTDACWPTTMEAEGITVHHALSCPGATGAPGPPSSLAEVDAGRVRTCSRCRFDIETLGKTPAASTSIDNGFEYHLREFTLALDDYARCREREMELERRTQGQAKVAGDAFEQAIDGLAGTRPRIAPPGRHGCVALVVSGEIDSPDRLETAFFAKIDLGRRGAISAAVLAPQGATAHGNVLSEFFSSLRDRAGGGGPAGLIDDVMGLWGKLLISYGDMGDGLHRLTRQLLGDLSSWGLGPIATWLSDRLEGALRALDLEPVDLSLRKPVLTDSAAVIAHSDLSGLRDAQGLLRSIPLGSTDPADIARALGYGLGDYLDSLTFTIAEIPLPAGGSIPLTIRVRDVADAQKPKS